MRAGAYTGDGSVIACGALVIPWAIGMAGLLTSGWPQKVQVPIGIAYTLAAIPALPLMALVAVCTTGNCL